MSIESITERDFSARAALDVETIRVTFAGNADVLIQAPLEGFLGALHGEAGRLGVVGVELDCRELQFMNSSCLKALVTWIAAVQESEVTRQYRICFVSNPGLHWQKRSLHALSCFAADLVSIQS